MMPRLGDGAARHVKRVLLLAAVFAVVALLNAGGVPILRRLYAAGWIAAEHYHVFFAGLCILPAAVAHGTAAYAGARGDLWWTLWLPGIAVYAAFPWQQGESWHALWIFGHALDWARTIFLHWDTAPPFVFNSFGAFATMLTVAIVACGRIWLGAAKAIGRKGGDVLAPDGAEGALPSASWASRREIVKRFSEPGGIVLGELTDPAQESPNFSPERSGSWGGQGKGQLITMSPTDGNGHVLVTSQASGYKSTGLVIPNILTYDDPLVVFDPKCELYARCRKAREDMDFTPVVIDADNGFDPARLIATLASEHPSAYLRMAKMVIPKGHGGIENSQYFKDAATNLFTALLAHYGETKSSSILQDIARVLAQLPNDAHAEIKNEFSEATLPFVRNEIEALKGMDPKFWYSVKTEITNQLLFCSLPDVERYITMKPGSKLPSQVVDPHCDIFLNIPQNVAEDFAPMLRLMLGSMLTAAQLIEVNEAPRARRLFLIDEAAKLGAMDILENIRDRGRSLGLHLMMFYQTPGELERLWGRAGMTSWRDGCSATVMGPVSSRTSAQDLSAMIGTRTLRVTTESKSTSNRVMSPRAGSVSTSEQEQLRDVPLISPTAISQLPRHASIITVPGEKPMRVSKAIWFTRKDMKGRVRRTDQIKGELAVTASQDELTERLEELSQVVDQSPFASLSRTELEALQRRDMGVDPGPGSARDGDDEEDASLSLSDQAKAKGPRYDRDERRPSGPAPRKFHGAEESECPGSAEPGPRTSRPKPHAQDSEKTGKGEANSPAPVDEPEAEDTVSERERTVPVTVEAEEPGRAAGLMWLDLDDDARGRTEILAPTREIRAEINDTIRKGLAAEGALSGPEIELCRLVPLGMTRAETADIGNWNEGDAAVIRQNLWAGKAKAGEIFTVIAIEGEHAEIVHDEGRVLKVKPGGKNLRYQLELHEAATIHLQAGDVIRWTRDGKRRDLVNGEKAQVVSIGPQAVRFQSMDGRGMKLSRNDPQLCHLEYGYSSTDGGAQGTAGRNVIAVLESGSLTLADETTLYAEAIRAADQLVVLTDSLEQLAVILEGHTEILGTEPEAVGERPGERKPEAVPEGAIPEKPPLLELAAESSSASQDGRDGDAWTSEETGRFMKLVQEDMSLEEIAEDLGRSVASVKAWNVGQRARGLLPDDGKDEAGAVDDTGPGDLA